MIGSFRNFAKTKFAGILVFIMIIPFVFWGMGSMFSSGNTNTIAKINKTNISTQDFIDYLSNSGIPQKTIRENLDKNIIEELLSGLVATTLLDLEVEDFNIIISQNTLLRKIKENKNFKDDNGNFERIKYEKFLLENNQTAPEFELRLKKRELQKNLFDYIGAGTISPKFLVNRLYEEENKKIEIKFVNLNNFYKKKDDITEDELKKFILENEDQLKIEYADFDYAIINPASLIGVDEFNEAFFSKIDQIEIDISNEVPFSQIVSNYNIKPLSVKNYRSSLKKNNIEKKIFDLRNNDFDLFEDGNDYILFKIQKLEKRNPDLSDKEIKDEISEIVYQKNKYDYNTELLKKITSKEFNENFYFDQNKNITEKIKINSVKDNKKFDINAVKTLYALPKNSFTLINDEANNIYLAKILEFENETIDNEIKLKEYTQKHNTKTKNDMLKSYDLYLTDKYNVIINQKTIDRVRNFFQ
tara:strand:- start:1185 stop:2600 length:1416 start_codon:yes stop_codon:yes gene_type:complete